MSKLALSFWLSVSFFAKPQNLAGIAVFLASDASAYLTGQVIYVDGGYLCARPA